jgi:hypothetical protein
MQELNVCNFDHLPVEIWEEIIQYLPYTLSRSINIFLKKCADNVELSNGYIVKISPAMMTKYIMSRPYLFSIIFIRHKKKPPISYYAYKLRQYGYNEYYHPHLNSVCQFVEHQKLLAYFTDIFQDEVLFETILPSFYTIVWFLQKHPLNKLDNFLKISLDKTLMYYMSVVLDKNNGALPLYMKRISEEMSNCASFSQLFDIVRSYNTQIQD